VTSFRSRQWSAGAQGETAHFVGHHREAAPGFASAGGLDGRVQGQQVGLLGHRADNVMMLLICSAEAHSCCTASVLLLMSLANWATWRWVSQTTCWLSSALSVAWRVASLASELLCATSCTAQAIWLMAAATWRVSLCWLAAPLLVRSITPSQGRRGL
jgi:hypothetical protein